MNWPAVVAAEVAEAVSLVDKLLVPALTTLGVLGVGVLTLIGTFRTSGRAAQAQRDAQLDERADKQWLASQAENARVTTLCQQREQERDDARRERDDYRERWVKLRLEVRGVGLDPDNIIKQEGRHQGDEP